MLTSIPAALTRRRQQAVGSDDFGPARTAHGLQPQQVVDASAVQVELEQELGKGVADLRSCDEEWVLRRRAPRRDEQRVACPDRIPEMECGRRSAAARLKAAVVEDDVRTLGRGKGVVGERAVDADRGIRLLSLREPPPRVESLRGPKPMLEGVEKHRTPDLVTTADAEVRAEQ